MIVRSLTALVLGLAIQIAQADDAPWYRIEIIVFAYTEPSAGTETWVPLTRSYPHDLVTIRTGEPRPHTYQALADVLSYERLFADAPDPGPGPLTPTSQTFLFESESRFYNEATGTLQRDQTLITDDRAAPEIEPGAETLSGDTAAEGGGPAYSSIEAAGILLDSASYSAWHQLPEEAKELRRTARSLRRSRRYRLLDHLLWAQPIENQQTGNPTAILIETGAWYNESHELAGTLTFSRSRYLHVNAGLTYTAFAPTGSGIPGLVPAGIAQEDLKGHEELVSWESALGAYVPNGVAHLEVSQRLRKGEVQYLDHPWFGLLIRIDDYKVDSASEPATASR